MSLFNRLQQAATQTTDPQVLPCSTLEDSRRTRIPDAARHLFLRFSRPSFLPESEGVGGAIFGRRTVLGIKSERVAVRKRLQRRAARAAYDAPFVLSLMNKPARGSLLGIEHLETKEILGLLKLARRMNPQKPRPLLRGKRIVLLFYEASTRTRSSFEFAAKSLGATTTLVQSSGSSIEKGESVIDTGYTLRAVGADCIVMRHPSAGAPHLMAQHLDIPIINAGDGMHEHPSQALLDAFTILKHKKSFKGLQATIIGDIFHSRVARSACHLLTKFGVKITLCGPPEFVPDVAATLAPGLARDAAH